MVVATDKVAVSLRTKHSTVAKTRFVEAYGALVRHFESVRAGPQPIAHTQAVALAGEVYRRRAERLENDRSMTPADTSTLIEIIRFQCRRTAVAKSRAPIVRGPGQQTRPEAG